MENNEKITFQHNGKEYRLTADEIEAAYRYQERRYRLEDAKRQLNLFAFGLSDLDGVSEEDEAHYKADFQTAWGVSYEEASTPEMCEAYADKFEDSFDCNRNENDLWEAAIAEVLASYAAARKNEADEP